MKKRANILWALGLSAALLAASLAGCGSTGTSGREASADSTAAAGSAADDTSAADANGSSDENAADAADASDEDSAETSARDANSSTGDASATSDGSASSASSGTTSYLTKEDITTTETLSDDSDGGHAIEADGTDASYSGVLVTKTGEASGDEADFYGSNAAVFATNGAALSLSDMVIETDGTHANAAFSYGEGTTVEISDSVIETSGNCSGGLMTTGGGTMIADNLTIHTTGNSSAAIRSDRGGGTVTVTGGSYTTEGTGSPVIYSTADITVSDALLTSTASQGVVVEGKNSVTLNDVSLIADNNTKNSDKSEWYQAVMIYQSMSGDADSGEASFAMTGGSLTNKNGDIFFVNNTLATITLENVEIVNEDADGVFLRAAAAGWGSEGSNGGKVNLYAADQTIDGDLLVDSVSALNLYLSDGSTLTGAVNPENEGDVYVEIESGSTWMLTGDSYVAALTCDTDAIDLNGYALYVNDVLYIEGTASEGTAVEMNSSDGSGNSSDASGSSSMGSGHSGMGPGSGEKPEGNPPAKR